MQKIYLNKNETQTDKDEIQRLNKNIKEQECEIDNYLSYIII